jgi:hypothetical protein
MQAIDQWFDKEEFRPTQPLSIGDVVLYDDWVGQARSLFSQWWCICLNIQIGRRGNACRTLIWQIGDLVLKVFNEALIASPTSKMQPVYELGGRFAVGEKCYGYVRSANQIV